MSTSARVRRTGGVVVKVILLVLGFSLLWSNGASAELYLKFDHIDGEFLEPHHRNWSEIFYVSWGVSLEPSHPGGGSSQADFFDVGWEQIMDKSFPRLFASLSSGQYIRDAKVDFTFGGDDSLTYFEMEFRNVFLTNLTLSGDSNSLATFKGSFTYDYIYMRYNLFGSGGQSLGYIDAEWDLEANQGELAELAQVYAMGMSGPAQTPLPASVLLLGTGLLGLAGLGWRRKGK